RRIKVEINDDDISTSTGDIVIQNAISGPSPLIEMDAPKKRRTARAIVSAKSRKAPVLSNDSPRVDEDAADDAAIDDPPSNAANVSVDILDLGADENYEEKDATMDQPDQMEHDENCRNNEEIEKDEGTPSFAGAVKEKSRAKISIDPRTLWQKQFYKWYAAHLSMFKKKHPLMKYRERRQFVMSNVHNKLSTNEKKYWREIILMELEPDRHPNLQLRAAAKESKIIVDCSCESPFCELPHVNSLPE
ncbi:hypothetical protein PENTCL1PPCAC_25941, partial [Pristionchus entomophagus]